MACREEKGGTAAADSANPTPACYEAGATKQLVWTVELKDSTGVVEAYEKYHSKEGTWPEVTEANKAAGIYDVKIYRQHRRLIMLLTVPADWDAEASGKAYTASSERIGEWGKLMDTFQVPPQGADSGQLWVPMKLIHHYDCRDSNK